MVPIQIYDSLKEVKNEIGHGIKVMTSSSNLLLLNVEDILGYA
jgi:hypothetical protein